MQFQAQADTFIHKLPSELCINVAAKAVEELAQESQKVFGVHGGCGWDFLCMTMHQLRRLI